jgi:hypothetical protein
MRGIPFRTWNLRFTAKDDNLFTGPWMDDDRFAVILPSDMHMLHLKPRGRGRTTKLDGEAGRRKTDICWKRASIEALRRCPARQNAIRLPVPGGYGFRAFKLYGADAPLGLKSLHSQLPPTLSLSPPPTSTTTPPHPTTEPSSPRASLRLGRSTFTSATHREGGYVG